MAGFQGLGGDASGCIYKTEAFAVGMSEVIAAHERVLAVRGLRGADDAGLIRLQTLELPQLYEQLKGRSWLTSLDIVNDLWLRLLAHYHDEDGSKQKRLQAHDSCGDWSVFQGVLEPLSHVMQVVGIPLTGPCSLARSPRWRPCRACSWRRPMRRRPRWLWSSWSRP